MIIHPHKSYEQAESCFTTNKHSKISGYILYETIDKKMHILTMNEKLSSAIYTIRSIKTFWDSKSNLEYIISAKLVASQFTPTLKKHIFSTVIKCTPWKFLLDLLEIRMFAKITRFYRKVDKFSNNIPGKYWVLPLIYRYKGQVSQHACRNINKGEQAFLEELELFRKL